MKPETVQNSAYKVLKNDEVTARVKELKDTIVSKQLWTREDSVRTLKSVIDDAERLGDKVSAVKELNAMHGFNAPTKSELTIDFPKVINVIAGRV